MLPHDYMLHAAAYCSVLHEAGVVRRTEPAARVSRSRACPHRSHDAHPCPPTPSPVPQQLRSARARDNCTQHNVRRATYNIQRATCNIQRATYNVQRTTRPDRHDPNATASRCTLSCMSAKRERRGRESSACVVQLYACWACAWNSMMCSITSRHVAPCCMRNVLQHAGVLQPYACWACVWNLPELRLSY